MAPNTSPTSAWLLHNPTKPWVVMNARFPRHRSINVLYESSSWLMTPIGPSPCAVHLLISL